jgi:DNA-binding NarL/FixJ family response regulator
LGGCQHPELIQYMARRIRAAPLLFLGLYRSTEVDRAHALSSLLADLTREHLADCLELSLLSAQETEDLIGLLSDTRLARSVAQAIYSETDGNPFFIEEIVRHRASEGRSLEDVEGTESGWSIPGSIRQAIDQRLSRLRPDTNRILEGAAVLGDRFTVDLLSWTMHTEPAAVSSALEQALQRGMIRQAEEAYQFAHPLFRRTVYDGIPLHTRQQLHLEAARAIEATRSRRLFPYLATLASHYRLAGPIADTDKVVDCAVRAAEAARSVMAFEEAVNHYQEAITLLEKNQLVETKSSRYCRLLLAIGGLQGLAGDPLAAQNSYQRAAEAAQHEGSAEHLARAALGFSGVQWGPMVAPGSVELLEKALKQLGDEHTDLRVSVMSRLAEVLWALRQDQRGRQLAEDALTLARQSGSQVALIRVAVARAWICPWPEISREILSCYRQLPEIGEEQSNWHLKSMMQAYSFMSFLAVADIESAEALLDEAEASSLKARIPGLGWGVLSCRAALAAMKGDFDEGESLHLQARNAARCLNPEADQSYYIPVAAAARVDEARGGEIERYLLDSCRRLSPMPILRAALAALYLRLDQREELLREYGLLAVNDFKDIREGGVDELYVLAVLAEACATLGNRQHASILYRRMEHMAEFNITSGPACAFGAAARSLGLLAATMEHWNQAIEYFEAALEMNQRMGAKPWVVLTQRDYALALLGRGTPGDRRKADLLLAEAQAGAASLGMYVVEQECSRLRAEPGTRRARLTYPDGLTGREVEVLRHLAGGKPNREIARLLGLSPHTIERHVANIYVKANLHNRVQAVRYALEKKLVSPPDPRTR